MMASTTFAILVGLVLITLCAWTVLSSNRSLSLTLLHNLAWAIGFFIYGSGLLNYDPIGIEAWSLILVSILAFNLVVALRASSDVQAPVPLRGIVGPLTFAILIVLFMFGWLVYLATVGSTFGLGTLLSDPQSIRASDQEYMRLVPLWARFLLYLGPLVIQLCLFSELQTKAPPRLIRAVVFAVVVVALVSLLQRTNLFIALLWAIGYLVVRFLVVHARRDSRVGPRGIAAVVGLIIIGAASFQVLAFALHKTGTSNVAVSSVVDPRVKDSDLIGVASYATSGIVAFSVLTESDNDSYPPDGDISGKDVYGDYNPVTYGRATFAAISKALPLEQKWRTVAPFVYTPMPTNVYTWLEPWYRDFRWFGVLAGSLVVGGVIGSLLRAWRRGSPAAALSVSLLVGLSGLATFVNQTLSTQVIVLFGVVIFLDGWSKLGGGRTCGSVDAMTDGAARADASR